MNQYAIEQVESEVIQALLLSPDKLHLFPLKAKYFLRPQNSLVFQLIEDKMAQEGGFSLVNITELADKIQISDFFRTPELGAELTPDYLKACRFILEKYVEREIKKLTGGSISPTEVKERVDALLEEGNRTEVLNMPKVLGEYEKVYEAMKTRSLAGLGLGVQTTWPKFNDMVNVRAQDLMIVGARPSIGKTAFAINLAMEAAFNGQKVLFASAEMGLQTLMDRFFALACGVKIAAFRYGNLDFKQHKKQLEGVKGLEFLFGSNMTSFDVMSAAKRLPSVDMVIVDYLQLLSDETKRGETENNRVARISRNLKQLAIQKNCAVVALAQLNRGSEKEKREPRLSDLRDSGSIEQDADIVALLHRESREDREMLVRVAKNRNGVVGDLCFGVDLERGKFMEIDKIDLCEEVEKVFGVGL